MLNVFYDKGCFGQLVAVGTPLSHSEACGRVLRGLRNGFNASFLTATEKGKNCRYVHPYRRRRGTLSDAELGTPKPTTGTTETTHTNAGQEQQRDGARLRLDSICMGCLCCPCCCF